MLLLLLLSVSSNLAPIGITFCLLSVKPHQATNNEIVDQKRRVGHLASVMKTDKGKTLLGGILKDLIFLVHELFQFCQNWEVPAMRLRPNYGTARIYMTWKLLTKRVGLVIWLQS